MIVDRDEFVVTWDAGALDQEGLIEIVQKAGYQATVVEGGATGAEEAVPDEPVVVDDPDYVAALARAKEERRPLVIDFYADWCGPCRRMMAETFSDPKVAPLLGRCVFLKVDTDKRPELARAFSVAGLPDVRILDADGRPLKRLVGFQDAESFSGVLRQVLDEGGARAADSDGR